MQALGLERETMFALGDQKFREKYHTVCFRVCGRKQVKVLVVTYYSTTEKTLFHITWRVAMETSLHTVRTL